MWLNIPSGGCVEHSNRPSLKHQCEHPWLSGSRQLGVSRTRPLCPFQAYGCTSLLSLSLSKSLSISFWQLYSISIIFSFWWKSFIFLLFFSRLSILMRVRVCCLSSAWLAELGHPFNESEMSVMDFWSLFQVQMNQRPPLPLWRWFQASDHRKALFNQWCGFGQGRDAGTRSPCFF